MKITKRYAKKLIREGKARTAGTVCEDAGTGFYYMIVERLDIGRTDHYYIPSKSKEYTAALDAHN